MLKKLSEFIQKIVNKLFDSNYSLLSFKHDYNPDEFDKREREKLRQKEHKLKSKENDTNYVIMHFEELMDEYDKINDIINRYL